MRIHLRDVGSGERDGFGPEMRLCEKAAASIERDTALCRNSYSEKKLQLSTARSLFVSRRL